MCVATTAKLQRILDATAAAGGGHAQFPCGFHATLGLALPSAVQLSAAHCLPNERDAAAGSITLGACAPGTQQHIVSVGPANATGQAISGVVFDHTNLTFSPSRSSCAVTGGSHSHGPPLESFRRRLNLVYSIGDSQYKIY
jgi:hypothetical protein